MPNPQAMESTNTLWGQNNRRPAVASNAWQTLFDLNRIDLTAHPSELFGPPAGCRKSRLGSALCQGTTSVSA
jgi:hypothetical protein